MPRNPFNFFKPFDFKLGRPIPPRSPPLKVIHVTVAAGQDAVIKRAFQSTGKDVVVQRAASHRDVTRAEWNGADAITMAFDSGEGMRAIAGKILERHGKVPAGIPVVVLLRNGSSAFIANELVPHARVVTHEQAERKDKAPVAFLAQEAAAALRKKWDLLARKS